MPHAHAALPDLNRFDREALKRLIVTQYEQILSQHEQLLSKQEQLIPRESKIEDLKLLIAKLRRNWS